MLVNSAESLFLKMTPKNKFSSSSTTLGLDQVAFQDI